ncbi:MAG TPA: DNA-binding domain-containing protein [Polyangiaceae bacterium]|nr:DNA-binding domain-containing protein [Polyangiaceae bacterium]
MKLAELQRYFARAATSDSGPLPDLERVFVGSEQLPASERLAIYNRGYFYRLLDALASVFEHTKRVLGESDFRRLGLCYVARYPSEHPAVERVGRSFSEYLRSVAAPAPVVDLARLEWARLCALVAPNPASIATVAAIEPARFPEAQLAFAPSLQRLELDPRALRLFAGDQPSASDLHTVEATESPCGVIVWRKHHTVQHQSLELREWQALAAAASGATVARVCAVFDSGSAAADIEHAFRVLSAWFSRQWLERVLYAGRE